MKKLGNLWFDYVEGTYLEGNGYTTTKIANLLEKNGLIEINETDYKWPRYKFLVKPPSKNQFIRRLLKGTYRFVFLMIVCSMTASCATLMADLDSPEGQAMNHMFNVGVQDAISKGWDKPFDPYYHNNDTEEDEEKPVRRRQPLYYHGR